MSRRHFTFDCEGETCFGSLDEAEGRVGLLLVSGGNELRSGAFGGQARLAAHIAAKGYPVMRYDRRGIGDSSGKNGGFRAAGPDIAAALTHFRQICPSLSRIVGFGNCDAASALMLEGGAGCDGVLLANPWTFDEDDEGPAPATIRARYAEKIRNPREWLRLLSGGVSLRKLLPGLRSAVQAGGGESTLSGEMRSTIEGFKGNLGFIIAGRDRTGKAFLESWGNDPRTSVRASADHAFSDHSDMEWLLDQLICALDEQARQFDMG